MCVLPGCSLKGINNTKKEEIDYTVVEDEDLPAELKKLIDEKKGSTAITSNTGIRCLFVSILLNTFLFFNTYSPPENNKSL